MKLNILETHDRLKYLIKDQSAAIFQGAEDCLKINPLSLSIQEKSPYLYIFAHARTADDGINKILFWQPRLTIPEAQTNSYLFRAISHTDIIEVVWMIPAKELWGQFDDGNVTESNICAWSINMLKNNKSVLERPHLDDFSEKKGKMILKSIVDEHLFSIRQKKMMDNLYDLS